MAVRDRIGDNLVAGILLVAPLVITLLVLSLLVKWTAVIIDPIVAGTRLTRYTANIDLLAKLVAGGFVMGALTFVGYLSRHPVGGRVTRTMDRIPAFIPFIGTIYLGIRQVASAIGGTGNRFERVVLLEYPRDDVYTVGLITGKAPAALQGDDGQDRYSVYLPKSPNPTDGRTVIVPEDQFEPIDMSIQEGLKLMVTTGIRNQEPTRP